MLQTRPGRPGRQPFPSEEVECPSRMSQWENGTRDGVTLGGETKGSSLLEDSLGLGRPSPLLLLREKFGACDRSAESSDTVQEACPWLSRVLHSRTRVPTGQ